MAALRPFRRGIPLSLVIVRYFAYVIVAVGIVWVLSFLALSAAMNAGAVYPASYGAGHVDETVEALRSERDFDPESIPTAYRYVRLDDAGAVLESDLPADELESALDVARSSLEGDRGEIERGSAAVIGQHGVT